MGDLKHRNNSIPKGQRYTVTDFNVQFPDDAACLEWLRNRLYPAGIFCKACNRITKHHRIASRPSYSCDFCGRHEHPTAGTIFHKSPTSLRLWFHAIYLMASTRCGISAKQIQRETGVTYKTAWRMFNKIRGMLAIENPEPLKGLVEADESYFGGVRKYGTGRPMRGDRKKTAVLGIVERKGRVIARTIESVDAKTLVGNIHKYVLPHSVVYTDQLPAYNTVPRERRYQHRRINHSAGVYVMGDIHTNSVEGFWSLIKRGVGGVYHSVSQKYLQSYLDEYSFRYNHRDDARPMFKIFLHQIEKA